MEATDTEVCKSEAVAVGRVGDALMARHSRQRFGMVFLLKLRREY